MRPLLKHTQNNERDFEFTHLTETSGKSATGESTGERNVRFTVGIDHHAEGGGTKSAEYSWRVKWREEWWFKKRLRHKYGEIEVMDTKLRFLWV